LWGSDNEAKNRKIMALDESTNILDKQLGGINVASILPNTKFIFYFKVYFFVNILIESLTFRLYVII
jgi:hypothetical protein